MRAVRAYVRRYVFFTCSRDGNSFKISVCFFLLLFCVGSGRNWV